MPYFPLDIDILAWESASPQPILIVLYPPHCLSPVFLNALDDDWSDNDDNELAEERRLSALANQGVDVVAAQKMMNGKTSSVEVHTNGTTNRKENGKA